MSSIKKKKMYVLSNFAVVCHIIPFCWQSCSAVCGREAVCQGFRRMWNFSITSCAVWVFNCGPSTRNACIKGVLLQTLLMVWWDRSRIQVEHGDLRYTVLG